MDELGGGDWRGWRGRRGDWGDDDDDDGDEGERGMEEGEGIGDGRMDERMRGEYGIVDEGLDWNDGDWKMDYWHWILEMDDGIGIGGRGGRVWGGIGNRLIFEMERLEIGDWEVQLREDGDEIGILWAERWEDIEDDERRDGIEGMMEGGMRGSGRAGGIEDCWRGEDDDLGDGRWGMGDDDSIGWRRGGGLGMRLMDEEIG
ncbi:hypothetical protein Tco_0031175 [Tanacetum coccineum]